MEEKEFDIFISYSRKDISEVQALMQSINQRIPDVKWWLDLDGIQGGENFSDKIRSSIEKSKIFLWVGSKNSMASNSYTEKEFRYAYNVGIKIIPVKLKKDTELFGWFLFDYGHMDCISIDDSLQFNKLIKNIAEILGKIRKPPVQTPPSIKYFRYPADADMHKGSEFPLSWEVENCTKVQLKFGRKEPKDVAPKGEHPFKVLLSRCTIILIAYNGEAKAEKKLTIIKEPCRIKKILLRVYYKLKYKKKRKYRHGNR